MNEFILLQETHSCVKDEIRWRDQFNGELFFSHGKTNSCWVTISFYGSKTIEQANKISDKSGRILLGEVTLNDKLFLLINIYTANTELKQIETLSDLESNLDKVKDIQNKNMFWRWLYCSIWYWSRKRRRKSMFEEEIISKIDSNQIKN